MFEAGTVFICNNQFIHSGAYSAVKYVWLFFSGPSVLIFSYPILSKPQNNLRECVSIDNGASSNNNDTTPFTELTGHAYFNVKTIPDDPLESDCMHVYSGAATCLLFGGAGFC